MQFYIVDIIFMSQKELYKINSVRCLGAFKVLYRKHFWKTSKGLITLSFKSSSQTIFNLDL